MKGEDNSDSSKPLCFFTASKSERGKEEEEVIPGDAVGMMWDRKGGEGSIKPHLTHIPGVGGRRTVTGFQT